jgi:hypothetical protein
VREGGCLAPNVNSYVEAIMIPIRVVIAAPPARVFEPIPIALDPRVALAETGSVAVQPRSGFFEPLMAVVSIVAVSQGGNSCRAQEQASAEGGRQDHSAQKLLS